MLAQEIRRFHDLVQLVRERVDDVSGALEQALAEHRAILAALERRRPAEARALLEGCLEDYADGSSRLQLGTVYNALAGALRALGKLEGAQEHYWRAYTLYDEIGSELSALPRYNVADMYVVEGRLEEARALLDEAMTVLGERPSALMSSYVLSMLVYLAAEQRRLEPLTPHVARLGEALETSLLADRAVLIKLDNAQRLLQARPEGVDPATLARLDGLVTLQDTRLKG